MSAQGWIRAGVLAAGAGAVVLAANAAPVHTAHGAPKPVSSTPVDAASLVCPGGEAKAEAKIGLTSAPTALASMLASGGDATTSEAGASSPVSLERGHSLVRPSKNGPVGVVARGPLAPGLAAVQYRDAGGALSARACGTASAEAWIPVGDKQSGRLLTLVLANPGSHAASVAVDVRSADGSVDAAQIVDKAVPAHGRVSVNIPADALAHAASVVLVRSEGGAVLASVRDSADGGGIKGEELTAQYAPAGPVQAMAGVPVADKAIRVRLAAPGTRAAVVRLQVWGRDGSPAVERVVTVPVNRSLDVRLDGIDGDVAAVRATSEVDIVASALGQSAAKDAHDFAWVPAAPAIDAAAGATVDGAGHAGRLVVMGEGRAASVTAVLTDPAGRATTRRLDVPADGVAGLDVPKGSSVWLTPREGDGSDVHAALLVRDAGANQAVTNVPLLPAAWTRTPVEVVQR